MNGMNQLNLKIILNLLIHPKITLLNNLSLITLPMHPSIMSKLKTNKIFN